MKINTTRQPTIIYILMIVTIVLAAITEPYINDQTQDVKGPCKAGFKHYFDTDGNDRAC